MAELKGKALELSDDILDAVTGGEDGIAQIYDRQVGAEPGYEPPGELDLSDFNDDNYVFEP